ncbi:50S ribosomal protein L1 [Candidatus Woesearchaeota archaeon]|nr:50S ribosomal protein L1 [Candidatus Woesearchaeota archaeon]
MEKKDILEALQKARAETRKRNFNQSVDLIINLRGIDLKKTENQLDFFLPLPHSTGRKVTMCALIGPELQENAKQVANKIILADNFDQYTANPKLIKKLSRDYDYFVGQANIMPKIAATFGRVLGPRGKMPNPKAGCIVPPNANLKELSEKLQKIVRLKAKTSPVVHTMIGKQDMEDGKLADNAVAIYKAVLEHIPNAEYNIRSVFIKLTMGKPAKVTR